MGWSEWTIKQDCQGLRNLPARAERAGEKVLDSSACDIKTNFGTICTSVASMTQFHY